MAALAPNEPSDTALVDAMAGGDESALAILYERWAPAVHGTALRVLGDRGLADDVTQGVFIAIWQTPEAYDAARGSLRSLLVSMAHNRSIDALRSNIARRRREDAHGGRPEAGSFDVVGDTVSAGLLADDVRSAVGALDCDERQAIELAYFGGRTYREVARELDLPEGTVKSRIRRGLERLATLLNAERQQ
jgi:RNA polymerase sigma-70 factor (ECF subfamily)